MPRSDRAVKPARRKGIVVDLWLCFSFEAVAHGNLAELCSHHSKGPTRSNRHRGIRTGGMRHNGTMTRTTPIAIALAALLAVAPEIWSFPQDAGPQATQEQATIRVPLPKGKKLVLADGTFQLVREYSVQGDRVRYWSVERSAWEELPTKLVDWDATHKAETEQSRQDADLKAKIQIGRAHV